jgi:dipeptide/tripeptide permease
MESVLGPELAKIFSGTDASGTRRVLGETISHTGYIIMIFQTLVTRSFERRKPIPTFLFGLVLATAGFAVIGYAGISAPAFVFLGILFFAFGEMISSPRIQEYITWIAPKDKAGLYMGMNFLATMIGALSGVIYTSIYGHFSDQGHPEYVWYILVAHTIVGIIAFMTFTRIAGEFREQEK